MNTVHSEDIFTVKQLRCHRLLSGTAIKAIVGYVSDYIHKPGLKTIVYLTGGDGPLLHAGVLVPFRYKNR